MSGNSCFERIFLIGALRSIAKGAANPVSQVLNVISLQKERGILLSRVPEKGGQHHEVRGQMHFK